MRLKRENHSDKDTKKGFSYYKSKLDIAEFLRAKGNDIGKNYFVEHKESTRTNPKFKKFNAEGVHIDTIGIYLQKQKNHAAYYFVKSWDAAYDKSALSIYDFLIQELGIEGQPNSLVQVHEMLKKFDEDGELYISDTINLAIDANNYNSAIDKFKQFNTVEKYSNFTYLKQRGLSETLLKNPNVNNSLRIISNYNKKIDQKISNTAFVMKGGNGYIAYSCRNKMEYPLRIYDEKGALIPVEQRQYKVSNFKGFPYPVKDSIYFCYLPKGTLSSNEVVALNEIKDLDQLSIYESGIDALSYYQLNTNDCQNSNILLASYEGAKGVKQDITICSAIEHYKPKSINLAFDNDAAGGKYALELILNRNFIEAAKKLDKIQSKSCLLEYQINTATDKENPKKFMCFEISLLHKTVEVDIENIKLMQIKFFDLFKRLKRHSSGKIIPDSDLTLEKIDDTGGRLNLTISKKYAWGICQAISELEYVSNFIQHSISNFNDWNEDLVNRFDDNKKSNKL